MDFEKLCQLSKELDIGKTELDLIDYEIQNKNNKHNDYLHGADERRSALRDEVERIQSEMNAMISAFCDAQEERGTDGNANGN